MTATVENNQLVVRVPLQPPTRSASGKTLVVASSRGNKQTDAEVAYNGSTYKVVVGFNAYIKAA